MVFPHSEWFNPNSQVVIHFFTSLTHPVLNRKWCSCVWKNWNRVALCGDLRLGRSFVILDGFEWKSSSMTLIHWGHNWKCPVVRMKLDVFFWEPSGRVFQVCQNLMGELWDFPVNPNEWKIAKLKVLTDWNEDSFWIGWEGGVVTRFTTGNTNQASVAGWWGMAVVLSSTLRGHWTRSLGMIFSGGGGMVTPNWEVKKILLGGHRLYQLTWSASGLKMTFWSFFFGRWRKIFQKWNDISLPFASISRHWIRDDEVSKQGVKTKAFLHFKGVKVGIWQSQAFPKVSLRTFPAIMKNCW